MGKTNHSERFTIEYTVTCATFSYLDRGTMFVISIVYLTIDFNHFTNLQYSYILQNNNPNFYTVSNHVNYFAFY